MMKTPFLPLFSFASAALLMAPCLKAGTTAVAGDALDVEFGSTAAAGQQPGFAFYNGGDATGATTYGPVSGIETYLANSAGNGTGNTVTVGLTPDDSSNPEQSYDRQGGNGQYFGTYFQFYDGWIGLHNFTINITGLAPISYYQITVQNFDQYGPGTATIYDETPNGETSGLVSGTASYVGTANGGASPSGSLGVTPNGESPAVFDFFTNTAGDASFDVTGGGQARINGFELSPIDIVPEPSTYAMLGSGGLLGLLFLARRHRA